MTSTAQQLAHDIKLTQALSINRNQRYRINFSNGAYSVMDRTATQSVEHYNNVTFPNGVTLTVGAGSPNFLVFGGLGQPYQNASLPGTALANASV